MGTLNLALHTTDRQYLNLLDRLPGGIPLAGKVAHQRLTGEPGDHHDHTVAMSVLDGLAVNGLATRTAGYMGKPGKYYRITDRGRKALRN